MNTIDEIKRPVALEMSQFEQAFRDALQTDHPLLKEALEHIILTVGKQLRPIMVLLSAKMCHGVNEKTIQTAVAMELLHTASLVHDDVVDNSPMRRGAPSVQAGSFW